jgi:hypothetical protein
MMPALMEPAPAANARKAARWLGVLAILLAASGVLFYLALKARAAAPLDPSVTPELRAQLERAPRVVLLTQLALAAAMSALWLWARRAPLAAVATAFALLAALQIYGVIVDHGSLTRGILLKVAVLIILAKALRAALPPRPTGPAPR